VLTSLSPTESVCEFNTSKFIDDNVRKDSESQGRDAKERTHQSVVFLEFFRDQAFAKHVEVVVADQVLVQRVELASHQALSGCFEAVNHPFFLTSFGFVSRPAFAVRAVDP
jgi:hypothetical protein